MRNHTFKKGEMILVTEGEYSDYNVTGLFTALKEFRRDTTIRAWCKDTNRDIKEATCEIGCNNKEIDYVPWLLRNGIIKELEYREFHTGSYGSTYMEKEYRFG